MNFTSLFKKIFDALLVVFLVHFFIFFSDRVLPSTARRLTFRRSTRTRSRHNRTHSTTRTRTATGADRSFYTGGCLKFASFFQALPCYRLSSCLIISHWPCQAHEGNESYRFAGSNRQDFGTFSLFLFQNFLLVKFFSLFLSLCQLNRGFSRFTN